MSEFDKISSYVDRSGLEKDTDFFLSQFEKIEAGAESAAKNLKGAFGKLETAGAGGSTKQMLKEMQTMQTTTADYSKILQEVAINVDKLTKKQKDQLKVLNETYIAEETIRQGAKQTAKLIETEIAQTVKLGGSKTELAKKIAENKAAQDALNRENKLAANLAETERNSLGRAQALILVYTNAKKKLNLATEEGRIQNENYNKAIQKSNDFILKNADAETKRTKNIGNYSKSAQIIVDALEKERKKLEELEKTKIRVQNAGSSFTPGQGGGTNSRTVVAGFGGGNGGGTGISKNAQADTRSIEQLDAEIAKSRTIVEGFSRVTEQPKFLNIAGKVGDANAQVRFFTKSLIELEKSGLGDSAGAKALRKDLAELTDQIGDTKAEIKALSSDKRGLDLFAGSVSFAADAFQTFAGAAVLAGASEDDVNESLKSLVAIQSVANGVKGIANELTTRGTAANKVYALVQAQVAIATDASATATVRLAAASKLLVGAGIIALIGLLVLNFSKLKDLINDVSDAQRKAALAQKTLNDALEEGSYEKAVKDVNELRINIGLAKDGLIDKEKVLKQYNETIGTTTGKVNNLDGAEAQLAKNAPAYIRMTLLKAAANLALEEAAKKSLEAEQKRIKDVKEFTTAAQDLSLSLNSINADDERNKKGTAATLKAAQAQKDAKIKADEDAATEQLNIAEKFQKEAAEIAKKMKFNLFGDGGEDDKGRDLAAANAKAELEILVSNANERARIQKEIADNEDANIEDRLTAEYNYYKEKKNILDYNLAYELSKKDLTEKEKKAITTNYANASLALESERQKERTELLKKFDDKQTAELKKRNDEQLQTLVDANEKEKLSIEEQYTLDTKRANERYLAKITSEEEYQKEKANAENKYREASLKAEIKYTKEVLELMKSRGIDVTKELQNLAKLERELSDGTVKKTTKDDKEKAASAKEVVAQISQMYGEVFDVIGGAYNASATAQKNIIQDQINDIEKKSEKEIEAVNASTLSEAEKADKIAIINARATAQKEALARQEKEIDIKKAKFDKANAIAQIIINTASAIVSDLKYPWKIAFDAAIGAAQLAIAVSTPIPKYKHGLDHDYEGLAIVGDGGKHEVHEHADGTYSITPDTDTLTYVRKGDRIHPDADVFMRDLHDSALRDTARFTKGEAITEKSYGAAMINHMAKHTELLNKISNKGENHISAKDGALVSIWKYGANMSKYLNENSNW